jgi:MFS family permease
MAATWRGDHLNREFEDVKRRNPLDRVNESFTLRNQPDRAADNSEAFRRDAPTLLCYGVLAAFAFWRYAFGLAPALLRAEMHFSYTLIGVYAALWSVGAMLVGVSFAAMARRLPRSVLLWGSAAGSTAGAGLFVATHTVAATLLGAAVLGFAGTILLTCTQVILSDRHGDHRDRELTEANIGASACAVLTPLLLGLLQGTAGGWRVAMGLPVIVLAFLYLRWRHRPLYGAPAGQHNDGGTRLSLPCWLLATLAGGSMAAEFCIVYFGAELLASAGLRTAEAATAMTTFYLGSLSGRIWGGWLTRRSGRSVRLLCISLAVTTAGFLQFWLTNSPILMIAGLFFCGLGVANLWPLSLSLTLAAAPGNGDAASARTQLVGGAFVIVAPYLLGYLSDHFGLHAAFTIELVLIGICGLLLLAGLRLSRPGEVAMS